MKNATLLLPLILLLASCAIENNPDDTIELFDQKTFDAQRQLWQEQDLQDYSFYLRYSGYARGFWEGTAVVKNGALDSFLFEGRDRENNEQRYYTGVLSEMEFIVPVYDIYDVIMRHRNWVEAMFMQQYNDPAKYSSSLEVEYDDEYHFPKYFQYSISYTGKEPLLGAGYSYTITITNFNPNPGPNILSFDRETFDAQRQLWLEQNVRNYTYHLSYSYQLPLIEDGGFIWKGTVVIKDGRDPRYTAIDDNPDDNLFPPPPVNGTELWMAPFSVVYDRILYDTQKNPGLAWGHKSQTTLEVEYDGQYHFPNRYRFNAEPVEPGSVPKGLPYVYEFVITDFTITP